MFEFRRQHPVAAVSQLFEGLKQNIIPLIILLIAGSRNSNEYILIIFTLGLISSFILGIVSWYRFTFRIYEDELQINKGIFVRKKLFLKKDKIQVIDITEGIIQRIFGLVQVEIKTAGGGTEKATISAITKEEAADLRSILRDFGITESEAPIMEDTNKKQMHVWKLSNRNLFLAALTSGNFGVIASILGVVSGQLDQFITDESLEYLASILPEYGQLSTMLWLVTIILIISYLLSFLGVILRYSDFRIEKKENELLITSGLLERKQITVPFDRIQAFRYVEGILRQPFGYGMLYVESAGFEQKEKDRSIVLLPFAQKDFLLLFLNNFIGELEKPDNVIRPPERSFFRYIRRSNYWVIVLVPIIWLLWDNAWVLFLLVVPCSLFGWLEFNDSEIRVGKKIIHLQYRVLAKTTAIIKQNRIQSSELTINPFQSRKKLANIHLTSASGAGGRKFSINDIDTHEAEQILKWA